MSDSSASVKLPFFVCKTCGIVDPDLERIQVSSTCRQCGTSGEAGQLYYSVSIQTLVKLMEQMDEAKPEKHSDEPGPSIAVVLFYCTLVESLVDKLMVQIMKAQETPKGVQERLLDDHRFVSQRVQKLFPSLTGDTWKSAVSEISDEHTSAYQDVNDLYLNANEARNNFLHAGQVWQVEEELPEDCLRYVDPTLSMFATLHNKYVAPHYGEERPYVDN